MKRASCPADSFSNVDDCDACCRRALAAGRRGPVRVQLDPSVRPRKLDKVNGISWLPASVFYALFFNNIAHFSHDMCCRAEAFGSGWGSKKSEPHCKPGIPVVHLQKGNLSGRVLVKVGNKLLR